MLIITELFQQIIADAAFSAAEDLFLRITEILELGYELRRKAEHSGVDVNASHLMVHAVMVRAFRDEPGSFKRSDLQEALSAELRSRLTRHDIASP